MEGASFECATIAVVVPAEESGWSRRRNLLLAEYEQIAWKLFAQHGFREVTVDEIIQAIWKVVRARSSFICLKLKQQLTALGYPQPLA